MEGARAWACSLAYPKPARHGWRLAVLNRTRLHRTSAGAFTFLIERGADLKSGSREPRKGDGHGREDCSGGRLHRSALRRQSRGGLRDCPGPRDRRWMQEVAREMNLSETAFLHRDGRTASGSAGSPRRSRWTSAATRPWRPPTSSGRRGTLPPETPARFQTRSGLADGPARRRLDRAGFPGPARGVGAGAARRGARGPEVRPPPSGSRRQPVRLPGRGRVRGGGSRAGPRHPPARDRCRSAG